MATTTTLVGIPTAKGRTQGQDMSVYEALVYVTGTYATASKPSYDVLAALQSQHDGISSVTLQSSQVIVDGNDGTNRYTAPDAYVSISGSVATFRIDSGAVNGATGTEIGDGTALNHKFTFLVRVSTTPAT